MVKKKLTEEQLETLIEEATMDCYDEYECINGFACSLDDKLTFPFKASVIGEEVEVIGVDMKGEEIVAACQRKGKKYTVDILDLEIDPDKVEGYEWIKAYKKWASHQ